MGVVRLADLPGDLAAQHVVAPEGVPVLTRDPHPALIEGVRPDGPQQPAPRPIVQVLVVDAALLLRIQHRQRRLARRKNPLDVGQLDAHL